MRMFLICMEIIQIKNILPISCFVFLFRHEGFSEVWQHTNPGEIPIVLHEFYVQVMRVPSKDGFLNLIPIIAQELCVIWMK